jgi:hypothetical protein
MSDGGVHPWEQVEPGSGRWWTSTTQLKVHFPPLFQRLFLAQPRLRHLGVGAVLRFPAQARPDCLCRAGVNPCPAQIGRAESGSWRVQGCVDCCNFLIRANPGGGPPDILRRVSGGLESDRGTAYAMQIGSGQVIRGSRGGWLRRHDTGPSDRHNSDCNERSHLIIPIGSARLRPRPARWPTHSRDRLAEDDVGGERPGARIVVVSLANLEAEIVGRSSDLGDAFAASNFLSLLSLAVSDEERCCLVESTHHIPPLLSGRQIEPSTSIGGESTGGLRRARHCDRRCYRQNGSIHGAPADHPKPGERGCQQPRSRTVGASAPESPLLGSGPMSPTGAKQTQDGHPPSMPASSASSRTALAGRRGAVGGRRSLTKLQRQARADRGLQGEEAS